MTRIKMKIITRFLCAFYSLVLIACSGADKSTVITSAELLSRINDKAAPVVLDVRTANEYNSSHVPGAINVPYSENTNGLLSLELKKSDEIVVYCETGRRAGNVEKQLQDLGFYEVRHLQGDMSGWRKAGLVVE
jgi:phage shock protein E